MPKHEMRAFAITAIFPLKANFVRRICVRALRINLKYNKLLNDGKLENNPVIDELPSPFH